MENTENENIQKSGEETAEIPEVNPDANLLKKIDELQKNTVPKEKYLALEKRNEQILDAYINGKKVEATESKPHIIPNYNEANKKLLNAKTNLEYAEASIEQRHAAIENGYPDPYVPHGKKIRPTREDFEKADNLEKSLQYCINEAKGDPAEFNRALDRVTEDVVINRRK